MRFLNINNLTQIKLIASILLFIIFQILHLSRYRRRIIKNNKTQFFLKENIKHIQKLEAAKTRRLLTKEEKILLNMMEKDLIEFKDIINENKV